MTAAATPQESIGALTALYNLISVRELMQRERVFTRKLARFPSRFDLMETEDVASVVGKIVLLNHTATPVILGDYSRTRPWIVIAHGRSYATVTQAVEEVKMLEVLTRLDA